MNSSLLSDTGIRIEIAISMQAFNAFTPGIYRFKIPVLMTENTVSRFSTSSANIVNRRNGNIGSSSVSIDNGIDLYVPYEFIFDYGNELIPVGTKFLIAFVGANINDCKIIGRYDQSTDKMVEYLSKHIVEIIELNRREESILKYANDEDNKIRTELGLEISNLSQDLIDGLQSLSGLIGDARTYSEGLTNGLRAELTQLINTAKTNLETKISQDISSAKTALETKIGQDIGVARTALESSISSTRTDLESQIGTVSTNLSSARSTLEGLISANSQADEAYRTTNDTNISALQQAVQDGVTEAGNIRQLINNTKTALETADATNLSTAKGYTDTKANALTTRIDTTDGNLTSLSETVTQIDTDLRELISTGDSNTLSSANTYTDNKISSLNTTLRGEISFGDNAVRNEFAAADDILMGEISSGDDAVRGEFASADSDLLDSVLTEIGVVRSEFAAADTTLRGEISSGDNAVRNEFASADEALQGQINDLRDSISTSSGDINQRITDEVETLNNKIDDTEEKAKEYTDAKDKTIRIFVNQSLEREIQTVTKLINNEVSARESGDEKIRESIAETKSDLTQLISDTKDVVMQETKKVSTEASTNLSKLRDQLKKEIADGDKKSHDDASSAITQLSNQIQTQIGQLSVEIQDGDEAVNSHLLQVIDKDVTQLREAIEALQAVTTGDSQTREFDKKLEDTKTNLQSNIDTLRVELIEMIGILEQVMEKKFEFIGNKINAFYDIFTAFVALTERRLRVLRIALNYHQHFEWNNGPVLEAGIYSNVDVDASGEYSINKKWLWYYGTPDFNTANQGSPPSDI